MLRWEMRSPRGRGATSLVLLSRSSVLSALVHTPSASLSSYLWLDATYLKVRDGGRIVPVAEIIAVAVFVLARSIMT
jgi:hypothetical protein